MSASSKSFSGELRSAADSRAVTFHSAPNSAAWRPDAKGAAPTTGGEGCVEEAIKYMTVHSLVEPAPLRFIYSRHDNVFTILYLEDYLNLSAENYLALYNEPSWKDEYQLLDVNDGYTPLTLESMANNEYEVVILDANYSRTFYICAEQVIGDQKWAHVMAGDACPMEAARFKVKVTRRGL